jgi:hypothetical protein
MRAIVVIAMAVFTVLLASSAVADGKRFTDWTTPVNLGAPLNVAGLAVMNPFISKDGRSLYFACLNCPGGFGGFDIYVAQRASVNEPWGPPNNLGPNVNTTATENAPALSPDEMSLYFNSNRTPGGAGGVDIWVSRRYNRRDDFGWQPPVNLGSTVNTTANDNGATLFEDEETGVVTLYFNSNRPGGLGGSDIYASILQPDGSFGLAQLVMELSTASDEGGSSVRRDGLEIFLNSDRAGSIPPQPGTVGQETDLWVSTRSSTSAPWSTPVNLGPVVNSEFTDGGPAISADGTTLYFYSPLRPGNVSPEFNLWVTTRRIKGHHGNHDCHHHGHHDHDGHDGDRDRD